MEVFPQAIAPVLLLKPKRLGDARGLFSELYSRRTLEAHGLSFDFVQDNFSLSADAYTVRGLHFQASPSEQTKLISVLTGAIFDVVVDLRVGSPTYGRHVAAELSAENGLQMLALGGVAWTSSNQNFQIAVQMHAPGWVRARAIATYILTFQGGQAIGSAVWGGVAERAGDPVALSLAATGLIAGLIAAVRWPVQDPK